MSAPPDPGSPDFGRLAVARFVESVRRSAGPSPSFTGPPVPFVAASPPASADRAGLDELAEARERAVEAYPGPVGELIARELEAAADFGFRFSQCTLHRRLVDHLVRPATSAG